MKIHALSITMRQVIINHWLKLMGMAIVWLCLTSAQNAEALGARFQLGVGSDSSLDFYSRGNLDVFLCDGTFAPYIGGEIGGSEDRRVPCVVCNGVIDFEYEYKAAVLGLQIKPFEHRRVVPYLVLGVIHGTVKYYARPRDFRDSIVSLSPEQASYTAFRGGVGLHIVLHRKLALEVELNGTGGVPSAYAVASNGTSTATVKMFDSSGVVNIAVGVRYDF